MSVRWDAKQGAVVSYGDDMVKPAPLTTETLMTAMPGGAIAAVSSDGTTEEVYGTCVKEAGVTYVSRSALAQTLDYAPQAMEPLLTAAGYTRADGVWQKEGRPLALTFVAPNNNADRLAAAETLAANLTDAGLEVELRALAWDDYLQALTAGEFDLYLGEVRLTADFDLPDSRRRPQLRQV